MMPDETLGNFSVATRRVVRFGAIYVIVVAGATVLSLVGVIPMRAGATDPTAPTGPVSPTSVAQARAVSRLRGGLTSTVSGSQYHTTLCRKLLRWIERAADLTPSMPSGSSSIPSKSEPSPT